MNMLTDYLHGKNTLLIFDNCEHLVEASAQLAETLLEACPNLSILISSREALGIPGESAYRVPSLSVPDAQHPQHVETLAEYESVRLFMDRAQTALPGFIITNENARVIAQICARLDGIPLAIELAAVRIKILRVEQIAERLDDRFRLLTGGSRTALPRQQTLRALIDWSYDLLSAAEKTLLIRLSIFMGGWTLEAAEQICSKSEARSQKNEENQSSLHPSDILDLLAQLVNKSLVVVDADESAETRYRMLETIRQYAREKLFQAGDGELVRNQHLNYFMRLAERAEPEFTGPHQVLWMERLDAELDNLRAALEWSLEQDVEAGLRLAGALRWYWITHDHIRDGSEPLTELLAKPQALAHTAIRAKALGTLSEIINYIDASDLPQKLAEESLALYRALGDKRGLANGLLTLAGSAYQIDFARAGAMIQEGLAHYREIGDKPGLAQGLGMLGYFIDNQNYEQPRQYLEESLAICRELGHLAGIGENLNTLGNLAIRLGQYDQARIWLDEALEINRKLGKVRMAETLMEIGILVFQQHQYKEARSYFEENLSIMREKGRIFAANWAFIRLGYIALRLGETIKAREIFEDALQRFTEAKDVTGVIYTLEGIASLTAQNQPALAARLFACVDTWRETQRDSRPLVEQADIDRDLALIHTLLDAGAFAAAWAAGQAMSLDEAVAYATVDHGQ